MAMSQLDTIRHLMKLYEAFNAVEAMDLFAPDGSYRFGNFPPAVGSEQIRAAAASSHLDFIKSAKFNITELLEFGNVVVCEMEIEYVKTDDSILKLPCTDVFRFENGLIKDMRIYMDATPLFAAMH
jgi:limonene-1,2-epoxide hydrolase